MHEDTFFRKFRSFPKVDLHRHLEGSITPETLITVATIWGGNLPTTDVDTLRKLIVMQYDTPGFHTFLDKFKIYRGFYPCREAIEYIAATAVKEAAEDGVKYLELRYSPTHFSALGRFSEEEVIRWINGAIQHAASENDIIVIPLATISRDYGIELAEATVSRISALPSGFFYGLDLAGDEISNPAQPFAGVFALARAQGLYLTIHAGEACGPENVREAVSLYGASRIGHGIKAAEDPAVMQLLRERNVMLEICLTSNVHTGVVPSVGQHPIKTLMQHGVPVSLNTDDPAISGITLTDEYVTAVTELGLTEDDLNMLN
ncbi:MAG: adenosine deaminase, partial [Desulfobacterota bacterium]|nr:adenosine deaminase [Thermodesulfobacteriota bacterium]